MKLHKTVQEKILRIIELHSGRRDNTKLIQELGKLDLAVYTQKENPNKETFLVLTEDLK